MADPSIPEMVLRVAKALAQSQGDPWESLSDGTKQSFCTDAEAAISVMREPTIDMIAAGIIAAKKTGGPWLTLMEGLQRCPETWQAMIDAALKE